MAPRPSTTRPRASAASRARSTTRRKDCLGYTCASRRARFLVAFSWCERGFSLSSAIKVKSRNQMATETLDDHMLVATSKINVNSPEATALFERAIVHWQTKLKRYPKRGHGRHATEARGRRIRRAAATAGASGPPRHARPGSSCRPSGGPGRASRCVGSPSNSRPSCRTLYRAGHPSSRKSCIC